MVMVIAALVMGVTARGMRQFTMQQRNERLARLVMLEVTLARSYAMRAGSNIEFVVNETTKQVLVRDSFGEVYRTLELGGKGDVTASKFDIETPGDSLTFSSRGLCLNCAADGSTTISLETPGRSSKMKVYGTGRVELLGYSRTG